MHDTLSITEQEWLYSEDSMTQRLKAKGELSLKIIQNEWHCHQKQWNRKVILSVNHQSWISAQTTIPEQMIDLMPFSIEQLQKEPIGHYLFAPESLFEALPLSVKRFSSEEIHQATEKALHLPQQKKLWGRCRSFQIQDQKLEVIEVFLPQLHLTLNPNMLKDSAH